MAADLYFDKGCLSFLKACDKSQPQKQLPQLSSLTLLGELITIQC